jgi:hypothetical protein
VATAPWPHVTVQVDGSGQLSTTQPVSGHATEQPLSGHATAQLPEVAQLTSQLAAAVQVTSQRGAPLHATLQSEPLPQVRAQSLSAVQTHESPAQAPSSVQAVMVTGTAAASMRAVSKLARVFIGQFSWTVCSLLRAHPAGSRHHGDITAGVAPPAALDRRGDASPLPAQ